MKNLKKSILISSAVMLGVAGTLYAANTLTIPTRPAKHDAYLSTLVLGDANTGKYTLSGDSLIVPERMIAGGIGGVGKNTINESARFAVIGGGGWNAIGTGAEHSVIGAGRTNSVSSANSIIGAGETNIIEQNAEGAFIGGGMTNKISSPLVGIAGGTNNQVSAKNTIVLGGVNNAVKAINSLIGGRDTDVSKTGTFAYSDFYATSTYNNKRSPAKENTTIIRAYSGMAINTGIVPAGVNVNVGGAVQMDGQQLYLITGSCNTGIAGTFEVEDGCFYYCDGKYWQALNVAFNEGTNPANPDASKCEHRWRCEFDGIKIRPGDIVTAYKAERSADCKGIKKDIECGADGTFGVDAVYKYSYCMTWDGTDTGIIANYHPDLPRP